MEFANRKPEPPGRNQSHDSLGSALYKVLEGIRKTWQLGQNDLASILHREPSTISTWKNQQSVSVSKENPSPNDAQIFELVEFFDSLTSLIVRDEDQIQWLKTKSVEFGDKCPMELLRVNSKNLFALREHIDRIARP